ncbi:MAG: serine/threonine protein kinase, partial [Planctomycetia bacterium]|nr:serine/threonine protein kinase [Planctomycetia bacterium]
MGRDADLLFGLLAHHLGFASPEKVTEAVEAGGDVAARLQAAGTLLPSEAAALRNIAAVLAAVHGGDAGRALAAAPVDAELRRRLAPGGDAPSTEVRRAARVETRVPGARPAEEPQRYRLGAELGRGGLGRVVEAFDSRLERDVAIKLGLADLPLHLVERFSREARLTARLEHPNIVPVHDFGALPAGGGKRELFLCMKRVRGRDLGRVLRGLAEGREAERAEWSRVRLLGVFQGICLGVAYAHSKGVIHRDLKPANVMIGDFGEVLVVDWGLAKDVRQAEAPGGAGGRGAARDAQPELTLDGDILGTPAYMSPEQAAAAGELDARSDIFALGAILYEMLALRPPYVGKNFDEVITSVKSGSFRVPSAVALPAAGSVPAELEAIVLKAMAFDRNDRYASALDLHRDVQLYIEGVKERERARREAEERAEAGWREIERHRALRSAIEQQEAAVRALADGIPGHLPIEHKRPLWDAEERLKGLREERIASLTRATALFEQALLADAECARAGDGRCELVVGSYLEAEAARDRDAMSLHRHRLESIDIAGTHVARLDAPGRLALRAFAYECDCLKPVPGLRVAFEKERLAGWRDGLPAEEIRREDRPVGALRVSAGFGHRPDCPRREVAGLAVRGAPLRERDRRLVPEELRPLGVTPLDATLPQGSWTIEVDAPPGFAGPVVFPVAIRRSEVWDQDVTLYPAGRVPEGFAPMPGGPFVRGGEWAGGPRATAGRTADLFVARHAVTCEEYVEFLNDLAAAGREDDVALAEPRAG